jgi:hypothetical protein
VRHKTAHGGPDRETEVDGEAIDGKCGYARRGRGDIGNQRRRGRAVHFGAESG